MHIGHMHTTAYDNHPPVLFARRLIEDNPEKVAKDEDEVQLIVPQEAPPPRACVADFVIAAFPCVADALFVLRLHVMAANGSEPFYKPE